MGNMEKNTDCSIHGSGCLETVKQSDPSATINVATQGRRRVYREMQMSGRGVKLSQISTKWIRRFKIS